MGVLVSRHKERTSKGQEVRARSSRVLKVVAVLIQQLWEGEVSVRNTWSLAEGRMDPFG
jgi:hypothetical protein